MQETRGEAASREQQDSEERRIYSRATSAEEQHEDEQCKTRDSAVGNGKLAGKRSPEETHGRGCREICSES